MGRQKVFMDKMMQMFHIQNLLMRQALAECLGTLILVVGMKIVFPYTSMFGCGAVAQLVLSEGSHGMFLTVNFAFGFAATLGILVCGQVSGGHLNPTVTFALCILGRKPWRKFPVYFRFQTFGAFLESGIIFAMYFDALWEYRKRSLIVFGENATAGIFATYPSEHLSLVNGFFEQVIGTAALIVCILAIVDPFNNPIPRGLEAFTVGFVVLVIGLSMGFNSGYAVNPARDLEPRIFNSVAGWGSEVFTANDYCFFVPAFAPFIGAIVGVLVYQLMVGFHLEGEAQDREEAQEAQAHGEKERLKSSKASG